MYFFRRAKVLTDWRTQAQLAFVFLLWFLVFLAIAAFLFLMNFTSASARTEGLVIHDQLITKMLLVQQTRDLALYYGIAIFGYLIFVCCYIMIYSHRMTGPIYKMNRILEKAIHNKEWPTSVRFRKGDSFTELAKNFNLFVETMKEESQRKRN